MAWLTKNKHSKKQRARLTRKNAKRKRAQLKVFLIILSFIDFEVEDFFILIGGPIHGTLLLFNPDLGSLVLFHKSRLKVIIDLYNNIIY